jgi:hypothetical protein
MDRFQWKLNLLKLRRLHYNTFWSQRVEISEAVIETYAQDAPMH